jgi:hypothetical protein
VTGARFSVHSISRRVRGSEEEEALTFRNGVNVIVGPHNSGKTKWLTILDFVLGDRDSAEQALGELAIKYDRATAVCEIDSSVFTFERRWSEQSQASKVFVDGKPITVPDFYARLMARLRIPIIHYPSGDPLGPRAWPELNFRSLLRHVFRQQKYWSDIADRQPYQEQHACLLQFLGLAESVFSTSYNELAVSQREIADLQIRKEQYLLVLDDVSRPLLQDEELGGVVTEERIAAASRRIDETIATLSTERNTLLEELRRSLPPTAALNSESLGTELVQLREDLFSLERQWMKTEERLQDIRRYRESLRTEQGRLDRALAAGEILSALKVTHCPACDRSLTAKPQENECYVCCRPLEAVAAPSSLAVNRVAFERERLQSELTEADQLIEQLSKESSAGSALVATHKRRIEHANSLLAPTRSASAALLPPELAIIDVRTGELKQRQRQLAALRQALDKRMQLSREIDEIHGRIRLLEDKVKQQSDAVDFESAADALTDGMNDYLDSIRRAKPDSWTSGRVSLRVDGKSFNYFVDAKRWSAKLGGTLALYFFISYHFGLLQLTSRSGFNYPGLLLLDLPAELEPSESIADRENFILQPFIDLARKREDVQVIVAGSSFAGLADINRITLSHVWQ